jgi:predicted nucleic acid-binding protein
VIVLDTNVVSELARTAPSQAVIDWVDAQDSADLVITAVTAAEIRAGVALLPDGRRQREIGARMEALITDTFAGHVLAFDVDSSLQYADILANRTRAGRPIGGLDAQIAAVCAQHDATLATRNTDDFDGIGLHLIDPWQPPASTLGT